MIVTHTINGQGQRRVYLGGRSSIEAWVEPHDDGVGWSFHMEASPACYPPSTNDLRAWANHTLLALADELHVAPADLKAVAFERIAALHAANPADHRRLATSRRPSFDHAYMSTPPHVTRPQPTGDDTTRPRRHR